MQRGFVRPGILLQIHRYFHNHIGMFKIELLSLTDHFVPNSRLIYLPQLRPTVIEQSRVIGGTWVYSPNTGDDEHGLPRSDS